MNARIELRAVIAIRAATGCGLLLFPESIVSAIEPRGRVDRATVIAARVLGARHLAEAAVLADRPSPGVLFGGAAIDAIHAASMVAVARLSPTHRRPALASAGSAAGFAAVGAVLAVSARRVTA